MHGRGMMPGRSSTTREHKHMTITLAASTLVPMISLAAGIAILVVPRLLNYIVAGYLIISGVLGIVS